MAKPQGWSARRYLLMNRWHARRAVQSASLTSFVAPPEPRTIGSYARGKQLTAGSFLVAGRVVEAGDGSIWHLVGQDTGFVQEAHGFGWLDDLAAVGDAASRSRAQAWTFDWIARHGRGRGAGWAPDLTGRRVIRWINHALLLLHGRSQADSDRFFTALSAQTLFLARRWPAAQPGLARFEALTGLICAGLSLAGLEAHVDPAVAALARECTEQIDAEGGIPSRNPEDLLDLFSLLTWAASALGEAGRMAGRELLAAIERIAPTLRALRHADGGLARFHGGGRGQEGRLDQALASSGVRAKPGLGLSMGFARLSAGRSTVIVDAAAPPHGAASAFAHASTLAFELTSGRRPVVVSCGSGRSFGPDWRRAGRATPSHSTLAIEGYSSSRFSPPRMVGGVQAEWLTDVPGVVNAQQASGPGGASLIVGHDGYLDTHGLTHVRRLNLSFNGRALTGEDTLGAMTPADRKRFDKLLARARQDGVRYVLRFHLHPDVDARVDLGGTAVSMALKSSEIWVFRAHGNAEMTLEPSVYLEKNRLKPRPTKQVVLSATVIDYASQISWTLAKAQDTPLGLRDLEPADGLIR